MKYSILFFMLLLSLKAWATELYLNPPFLGQVKIQLNYIPSSKNGSDLTGTLISQTGKKTPLPIHCPSEGGNAELGDVYTLESPDKLLIITCIYQVNHSGLGVKGVDYRPLVLDGRGGALRQRGDIEALISGYEGSAEDGSRSYFFYNTKELATLKIKFTARGQLEDPIPLAHKVVVDRLRKQDSAALAYYISPRRVAELLKQAPISIENSGLYNDIGYALSEIGNQSEALNLLYAIEEVVPDRVVLMLNIADALWASGDRLKAKVYYSKYQKLMNTQNKEALIPLRVNERIIK